jgi:hypothetical protein
MNNWSDELDDILIEKHQLNITNIPAGKQDSLFWLKGSLFNRILSFFPISVLSTKQLAYASNKRSWQLMKYIKKASFNYDHIEAHTLGALYPAYHWTKKSGKTFSFDVEDFHPEEKISFQAEREKKRRYKLMKHLLPAANYITAAAPLIAREVEKLINQKVITINNSFSEVEFKSPKRLEENEKLKLIWFSQHISFGRGLEQFIDAAYSFKDQLSLTLVGQLDEDFHQKIIQAKKDFIEVKKALPQEELHAKLADYDVGLALEDGNEDYNRQICLTNKIWAYFQAGLYTLATNTKAQIKFISQNADHGELMTFEKEKLNQTLHDLIQKKQAIRGEQQKRFLQAKTYSFEKEMEQLKEMMS